MSNPRLQDGARGDSTSSAKTPGSIIQQFLASLTAACLALDELDVRRLRDNDQYIAKMNRLMVPMFTFPSPGEGDVGGDTAGKNRRKKKGKGTKSDVQPQPQRAPLPREPAVVAVTPALAKDPPPAPSLSPLPPSTTSLSPRPPQTTTSTPPSPLPKPVQEHIRRLGPNEPRSELTLDVQYQIVDTLLKKKDMKEGEGWYLVSSKWWNSWVKACNNAKDPALGAAGIRYTMNPIDNTDLWDSSQNTLRKGLGCLAVEYLGRINGPFFVVVPREVWEVCLGPWYGQPSHVFIRPLYNSGRWGLCVDLQPKELPPTPEDNVWEVGTRWKLVNRLIGSEPPGETLYAISNKWWTLWRLLEDGMPGLDETGAIDNSDLLDEQNKLKKGLPDGSYVRVPLEAWHLLKTWFGTSTPHDNIIVRDSAGKKGFFPF